MIIYDGERLLGVNETGAVVVGDSLPANAADFCLAVQGAAGYGNATNPLLAQLTALEGRTVLPDATSVAFVTALNETVAANLGPADWAALVAPDPYPPGTHLKAARSGGLYAHEGVSVGSGQVVELAGDQRKDMATARVRESSLEHFADGAPIEVVPHSADALPPDVIVERARSLVGEPGYDVVKRNCEHVARWSVTGKWESKQVQRWITFAGLAALAVVVVRSGARGG